MITKSHSSPPNVGAVLVVGGVGWIGVAVLSKLTTFFNFTGDTFLGSLILVTGVSLAHLAFWVDQRIPCVAVGSSASRSH